MLSSATPTPPIGAQGLARQIEGMAPFASRGNLIALASEKSLLLADLSNGNILSAELPDVKNGNSAKSENKSGKNKNPNTEGTDESIDNSHISTGASIAISHCNTYVAVCTSNKCLTIWKTENLNLVHQWIVPRKVSALYFTYKSNQLIVADKAGDCFAYPYSPPCEKGKLLLGHLSMLLDVLVTADDKYVITSERDEKIRVSCFPNAYNIHTFCLGHTEFVTSLSMLQSNLLLSGSGDATIRLWDFIQGKELLCVKTRLSTDDEMEKAIRSVVSYSEHNLAAVLLNRCKKILVYKFDIEELKFQCQELDLDCYPLAVVFSRHGDLCALTDDQESPIKCFKLDSADFKYIPEVGNALLFNKDANCRKIIQDCANSCNGDLKPLYKRWFDNMQAYRERKGERLAQKKCTDNSPEPKKIRVD